MFGWILVIEKIKANPNKILKLKIFPIINNVCIIILKMIKNDKEIFNFNFNNNVII